jgi:hypothetical protein
MEFMAPNKITTDTPQTKSPIPPKSPKVLVVDVGGTNVKMLATGQKEVTKIPSGPTMTASKAVDIVTPGPSSTGTRSANPTISAAGGSASTTRRPLASR